MILLGIGAGTALTPLLVAATSAVVPADAGLASGIANTSFMLGGALGLAVLASLAAGRTRDLLGAGQPHLAALTGGYHVAYLTGAGCAAVAGLLAATWLRPASGRPARSAPAGRAAAAELVTTPGAN
jgi:hypothetical protein